MNTPNDLAIDRQGRIWFSNPWNAGNIDPSEKEIPGRNAILRADPQPDGTWVCKRMTQADTTGTNGLLISADGKTLYMIQTSPERRELIGAKTARRDYERGCGRRTDTSSTTSWPPFVVTSRTTPTPGQYVFRSTTFGSSGLQSSVVMQPV